MNIYIGEPVEVSDMQGPCPDGFHVPLITEWEGLKTIMDGLGLTIGDNWRINLHMPFAGNRDYSTADLKYQDSYAYYWSSSPSSSSSYPEHARRLYLNSSYVLANNIDRRANGFPVRCFKDSFELPTSSWTVITGTLGGAGIFRNQTDGLISITSDGTTGYTIQDKNLGATTVYNNGDTLTQANMGNMYQWGNNYGFSSTGSVTTSSTRVNAQNYGPGNYYSGSTFIKGNNDWSSVQNDNLRGGVSQGSGTKSVEVQNIYIGDTRIYKGEYIEYKMNADSSGNLYVPLSGRPTGGGYAPYDWKVSVDGGTETTYSGTGGQGAAITLNGYTSGTSHIIKIRPTTEDYQWARAYGWFNTTTGANLVTEVIYDCSYMGYAVSATNTGNSFRSQQYKNCTNLTVPAIEYLPDTVTTIGDYYRESQYYGCTSLTYSPEDVLPNSVTSIGQYYRNDQYRDCSSLTEIKGWVDLSIGNSYYRLNQYYNCTSYKSVKVLSSPGYASASNNTLQNRYVIYVYVPSKYLNNFTGATAYPWSAITDSSFVGY